MRKCLLQLGVKTLYIELGSSWENGYIESFNGKLRDELLNREIFDFLQRKAKPDDSVEWKLWLEDVTINDGQVVKLAHFSGVKDGLYCDIVGHGVTEKQLRDFQAQLVTVTPESMDEKYQKELNARK